MAKPAPAVGDSVWVWDNTLQPSQQVGPLAGVITQLLANGRVNVFIMTFHGKASQFLNIPITSGVAVEGPRWCTWTAKENFLAKLREEANDPDQKPILLDGSTDLPDDPDQPGLP